MTTAPPPPDPPAPAATLPAAPAPDRALRLLFWLNRHAPAVPRLIKRPALELAWMASSALRRGPLANAARILGPASTTRERVALARDTVASFYTFICEVGAHQHHTLAQLAARVEVTQGANGYRAARAAGPFAGKGAVLVTAHFGNFEVGLAEVRKIEERVHVVFRRDAMGAFEAARSTLHRNLGIHEIPIDDGIASWLALRDALQADGVVLLQGDRAEPGQQSTDAPYFGAHLRVPVGPAKLALMTGAPLIPVFAVRGPRALGHRVRIVLGEPIAVPDAHAVEPATHAVVRALEDVVRRHPEQWHVMWPACVQDADG